MASIYTTVLYVQTAILNSLLNINYRWGFEKQTHTHKGTLGADVNIAMQFLSSGGRYLS